jgi:hypothetical protein
MFRNGGIEGGGPPLDPRVNDLTWGWGADGKVDRQSGVFFRLTVDNQHADSGFIVNCRSSNRGKFKLLVFDKEGNLLYQEDSFKEKDKSFTQSTLFFTTFDAYRLGEAPAIVNEKSSTAQQLPPLFHRLDSFILAKKRITSGQYLLCIYGDNFIGKTNFQIIAVPSKNDALAVRMLLLVTFFRPNELILIHMLGARFRRSG